VEQQRELIREPALPDKLRKPIPFHQSKVIARRDSDWTMWRYHLSAYVARLGKRISQTKWHRTRSPRSPMAFGGKPRPKQIGRSRFASEIGRGRTEWLRCIRSVLGREVEIKAIPLAADNQVRRAPKASSCREAKRRGQPEIHPGIVTVFDGGQDDAVDLHRDGAAETAAICHDWLDKRNRLTPRQSHR